MSRMFLLTLILFCARCGQFGSQDLPRSEDLKVDSVEVVEFCDILNFPSAFDGKEIQTTAILVSGFESAVMYDSRCIDKKRSVWFDVRSNLANEQLEHYMTIEAPEFKATGLDRVLGKFTGTFHVKKNTGFGHMNNAEFNFIIQRATDLSFVPTDTPFPW